MDIVVWLRSLGLGKYEAAFRENDIDETVLPSLTHETLKELGITAVGHRLKLLDAVAALRADASGKAPSADVAITSTPPSVSPKDRAERRQVTVMFSDLVGSTALSARMDPEDLREVISAYQKCVAETVRHFGGFVAKYMGDGVLIYFGYPQAHEDDAERAVSAGLELVTAVSGLKVQAAPLQTRVGIATGLVVVGDLIGSGEAQERGVVGETPNLAARLQGIAEPNMVVVADGTRRLLGNLFDLRDLGDKDLKGISGPVRAWAALRASSAEGRFEAMHATGLTDLVGRQEELELLLRRWSKAKTGEGQVVLLSGEPGIGKSRLTAALMERLAAEPHTRLRYFCSPQHTDSALYPIISQMERAAGFTHDDTAQAKLDKLDAALAQSFTPRQDAALLSDMLSLPNDGRYPTLGLTAQQRRQKTLDALIAQLEALSRSNPLLMIFEDAHWIDPTSELAILSQLGPALMSVHGWSAPEVGTAFERAEYLARELKRSTDLAPPLAGLWLFHTAGGRFSRAEEITKEIFNVAQALNDPDILLQAHHCAWPICWFRGELTDAKAHADAGLSLYDEIRHAKHRFLYLGHDPAVCASSIKSVLQWALGHPTQGAQSERDAIDLARRLQHVPSLAHALWFVCQAQVARGDTVAVEKTGKELLTLSEEHGLPLTHGTALACLGWATAHTDNISHGIRRLEDGLAMYNRLGLRTNLCLMICLLAEAYFVAGEYQRGIQQVNLAIDTSAEIGDRWCLPRIHTVQAQLLRASDEIDAAEASLRKAVDIAEAQSAKGSQLQAANSLARLWRDRGKVEQARELLAPVYGWFTEGFDTRDLKEAKVLLEELA